jgi:4-alpha-glucanotransferase
MEKSGNANWREWPDEYRRPVSPAVAEFRLANERDVEFHCYVQFELDRQLGAVASEARSSMAIGLYGDLALGSDTGGADCWAYRDVFVHGVRLGAPPDDFATGGQDWGLPPISPEALKASGYDFWIKLLRANLKHAGALRIDHAMGLFRQFWIPSGLPASHGAYVKFPARDLLGILALESTRNDALIVGEDLGTVPSGFQSLLARWGILSSRVLYFEHNRDGSFRHHREYSKRAMVTANTHDLVPLAGYWKGRDLELRRDAGAYADTNAYTEARRRRHHEQVRLRERLNISPSEGGEQTDHITAAKTRAAYLFLAKTPAPLVGVSLDDLAGEVEPVNLPGASNARFPSWSRKMGKSLGALADDADAAEVLQCVAAERS